MYFGDPQYSEVVASLYRFMGNLVPKSGRGDISFDEFTRAVATSDDPVLTDRFQGQLRSFGAQLESYTTGALTRMRSTSLVKYMLGVRAGEESESELKGAIVAAGDSSAMAVAAAAGGGVVEMVADAGGDGLVRRSRPSLRRASRRRSTRSEK
jgi:hypothetical protein